MIRHLLRLIWNRKRANLLIMIEILCAFLVLEAVVLMGAQYANNYRQPLGYSIDRVWEIKVDKKSTSTNEEEERPRQAETLRQILNALRDVPEVEASCVAFTGPYSRAGWGSGVRTNDRQIEFSANLVSDGCAQVLGITLTSGRWFSREDDGAVWRPVVVTASFARAVFGDRDPIGQNVPEDRDPARERVQAERGITPDPPMRVIGVVEAFRQYGEFAPPQHYVFRRVTFEPSDIQMLSRLLVKLRPGTLATFEEALAQRLQLTARHWSFEIAPVIDLRENAMRGYTVPLIAAAVVAGFLLTLVALGLTGVVWQNVTQRIREIGLRRAKGARIENIHQQILGELVIMTSMALLVGVLLLAQLPLIPLPRVVDLIPGGVFVVSIVLSVLAIYLLTIACGWYPARLATKIEPAEALHYE